MNKRTTGILLKIMENENGASFTELTKEFNVSQRTIRNDINMINEFLTSNSLNELMVSQTGAITYSGDKNYASELILQSKQDFYTYKLDKDERKIMISLLLLNSRDYITISAIADEMLISRQTLINDLEEVKKYFISYNLKIQSNPNKGMRVVGTENSKRNMIFSNIYPVIHYNETQIQSFDPFSKLVLHTFFKNEHRDIFEKIIKAEEERNNVFFTDASYMKVLYYAMTVMKRMAVEKYGEADFMSHNSKYNMATEILQYLCTYFHIDYLEDEVILLSEMLSGQRYIKNELSNDSNTLKIQMITTRFISAVSEELDLNLNMDFLFYENLVSHLEATLVQEFSDENKNPILDILTQNYYEVFEIARHNIYIFNEFMGREMNDHEISYVVMHICAAVERKKNMETPAKVIVVCSGGVGTSQLLVEKLKQQFRFDIIDVTSVHNLSEKLVEEADLIISTVALRDIDKENVIITPILSDSDYLKIQKKMKTINLDQNTVNSIKQEFSVNQLLEQYKPIIEKFVPVENQALFLQEITKITNRFLDNQSEKAEGVSLYELLDKKQIIVDLECSDYKEAIRAGGTMLLNSGAIEPRYIDAMIDNVEEHGPYFVISKGFAIPHADTECGVKKMAMSLIRLKEPLVFIDDKAGKIEFVCCLSAIDSESHTKALFHLINMLEEKSFKEAIRDCKTAEEMADIIKSFEEEICEITKGV